MAQNQHHATLGVISLGMAIGVTWGLSVLFLAIISGLFNWGTNLVIILQSLYVGYGPTVIGAISGAVWGFVDGLIFGVMIAWFYNKFLLVRRRHILNN